jgi:hypothetical protein
MVVIHALGLERRSYAEPDAGDKIPPITYLAVVGLLTPFDSPDYPHEYISRANGLLVRHHTHLGLLADQPQYPRMDMAVPLDLRGASNYYPRLSRPSGVLSQCALEGSVGS